MKTVNGKGGRNFVDIFRFVFSRMFSHCHEGRCSGANQDKINMCPNDSLKYL